MEPRQPSILNRSLPRAAIALSALLVVGVAGYHWLEGLSFIDSLYMTVITVTTVGFGEVRTLDPAGRLFTMGLIVAGGGIAAYTITTGMEYLVSGQWRTQWLERRKRRMLSELSEHVIVCGFGRVGRNVAAELQSEGVPFVVIEKDSERMALARRSGHLAIHGNAANDNLLEQAEITRARGLVAALDSDAENVYVTLTARGLNPRLFIVARANFEESESKLIRAGANRVLLPYTISGRRMVTMLLRPEVADFLDEISRASGMELLLEQVLVMEGSPLAGLTLSDARRQQDLDVTVLAYKASGTAMNMRPGPDTVLQPGMQVLALGTRDQLRRLMLAAKAGSG